MKTNKKLFALIIFACCAILLSVIVFVNEILPNIKSTDNTHQGYSNDEITTNESIAIQNNSEEYIDDWLKNEKGYSQEEINKLGYLKYSLYFENESDEYKAATMETYNSHLDIMEYPVENMEELLKDSYEKLYYHRKDDLKATFNDLRERYKFTNFNLYELTLLMHDVDTLSKIRQDINFKKTDYLHALQEMKSDKAIIITLSNTDLAYTASYIQDKASCMPTVSSLGFKDLIQITDTEDGLYKKVLLYDDMPYKVYKRELAWKDVRGNDIDIYALLSRHVDGTYRFIGFYSDTMELNKIQDMVY